MRKLTKFNLCTFLSVLILLGLVTATSQASHVDCDLFLETREYAPPPPDIHDVRGHGGEYRFRPTDHGHGIVKLYGFGLFVIRASDRTVVPGITIPSRLEKACKHLDEAIEKLEENPNLSFKIDTHRGRFSIVQVSADDKHEEKIIDIVPGDAIGYKNRDVHKRNITPELVAQYWLAALEDAVSVFVLGKKPKNLTDTHAGEVLHDIYKLARQKQSSEKSPEEVLEDIVLNELTHEQKEHLSALAFYIPGDFPSPPGDQPPDEHDETPIPPLPIDISAEDNSPLATIKKMQSTLKITAPTIISDKIELTSVSVEVFSQNGTSLYQSSIPLTEHPPRNFTLALPESVAVKGEVFTQGNTVSLLVKGTYNGEHAEAKFAGITILPAPGSGVSVLSTTDVGGSTDKGGTGSVLKKVLGVLVLLGVVIGLIFLLKNIFGSKRMSVTLALEADGQEPDTKTFTLEPTQESTLGPIWSQDPHRIRNAVGKLYLIRPDGTPPEKLSTGREFKISQAGGGQVVLRILEIRHA